MENQEAGGRRERRPGALAVASLFLPVFAGIAAAGASGVRNTTSVAPTIVYFACGALFVVAIVVAVAALRGIGRSAGALSGRGQAVAGLLLAVVGIAAWGVMLRPMTKARGGALGAEREANLNEIASAFMLYAGDNRGFPETLQALVDDGADPDLFRMPVRPQGAAAFDPAKVDATSDYVYARPRRSSAPAGVVIAWERNLEREGRGYVCYADFRVAELTTGELRQALEAGADQYAAPPLPPPAAGGAAQTR